MSLWQLPQREQASRSPRGRPNVAGL